MHDVHVNGHVPDTTTGAVFRALTDFARYPQYTDAVHAVSVEVGPDGEHRSSWCVDFAGGILKWRERDLIDPARHRIDFELLDGDLPRFEGRWRLREYGTGCSILFDACFDLGVPGMADVLEPVAARALTDTVMAILRGVLGPRATLTDRCGRPLEVPGGGRG